MNGKRCKPGTVHKVSTKSPQGDFFVYDKRVQSNSTMFVDPRFEDEAISALMEEALSEDSEETKFDVDSFISGDIDYA